MTERRKPREAVEAECERRGRAAVVAGCVGLLQGRETDPALIVVLGGPPARWALDGGEPGPDYWVRVWAARGLLWAWSDEALPALLAALTDESWRVREVAAKVVARHRLDGALPAVAELRSDTVPRVRRAAERAMIRLTDSRAG